MTPDERSRAFCPSEWTYDAADEVRVLILMPVEPENWPVLPADPSRLTRGLRLARNVVVLALVIAACYGLIAGITWAAWKVFA